MTLPLARATVDRAADMRRDAEALDRLWADPRARVVRVHQGSTAVTGESPELALRPAPSGPPEDVPWFFLGLDADGAPYFGVDGPYEPADGERTEHLWSIGPLLPDRDLGLLVHAVALANWHQTHTHCPRCGQPTRIIAAGHARLCDTDQSEHYPRTDPAVIMLVTDPDDRALLARQPGWPKRMHSTLAGFVEPGESLERAVIREVAEEVGLVIDEVSYTASQPWPFPASLMLAFQARTGQIELRIDADEIEAARWYTRAELRDAITTGDIWVPGPVSVAHRLIADWYGKPLPPSPPR